MANVEVKTPRFYCDMISSFIKKGTTQNGSFDVTATGSGFIGLQNGTEAELFDGRPTNVVDFDTSGDTDGQVLVTLAMPQTISLNINFIAVLNHNMYSADAKMRIFVGNEATDIAGADGANAETGEYDWGNAPTEVLNADDITRAGDSKSSVISPANNGSTIIAMEASTPIDHKYIGIQFEGTVSQTSAAHADGTFDASTDLYIGCIMVGTYTDMPHSPDMTFTNSIMFDDVKIRKSMGGQKYGLATNLGKSSTNHPPFLFSGASDSLGSHNIFYGRRSYDFAFSYINNTDLYPSEMNNVGSELSGNDNSFIMDVWNRTLGGLLPFIFTVDKTSVGDEAESEYIFARFDQNSLDLNQVAHKLFNLRLKIVEEF
jgi:hypothetical protein